ncbi:MAG: hypothetical protein ACRD0A_04480 [Acidimicrobiales bacterium]
MRRVRVSDATYPLIVLLALGLLLMPSDAAAQEGPDGEGASTGSGPSQTATGAILTTGEVEVTASESQSVEPLAVSGGRGGDISCHNKLGDGMGGASVGTRLDPFNPPAAFVGQTITYMRVCTDGSGNYVSITWVTATLPLQASDPVAVVDPRELALMARSRLPLPEPQVQTSPPLGREQIVNMASWLWIENWVPVSRSASAGGVTATATARPVSHMWVFGPGEWQECFSPGTPYDYSHPAYEQSTDCSYTFAHSSTIQPDDVHHVQVSISWEVTWTSNIGAGGALGPVSRSTSLDMVVGEVQVVNVSGEVGP